MNYSIIKVSGLSMNPFLQSNDLVIVKKALLPLKEINPGACVLVNNNIHRKIGLNVIKGDRLLYNDELQLKDDSMHLVLGRVFANDNIIIFSNYNHPILKNISSCISFLSNFNRDQFFLRYINLGLIIILSKTHRFIENFLKISAVNS